jgi:hypothetical protein
MKFNVWFLNSYHKIMDRYKPLFEKLAPEAKQKINSKKITL